MADIPDTVIVLFVILGAAATVCMGYAVHKLFYRPVATNFNAKSEPQLDYMREVRDRSKMYAMMDARGDRSQRYQ